MSATRPDPNQRLMESDMNSWSNARPGAFVPPFRDGLFAVYRTSFTPRAMVQTSGGSLILQDITGKAQVYLNGKVLAEKSTPEKQTFRVLLPPGAGERTVNVLIEAPAIGTRAGLGGTVTVE